MSFITRLFKFQSSESLYNIQLVFMGWRHCKLVLKSSISLNGVSMSVRTSLNKFQQNTEVLEKS